MKRLSDSSQTETAFIAPLQTLQQSDLERAGGKAANLGELIRAGFPVPGGFAVTTAAYDRFVAHNGLRAELAQAVREQPGDGAPIRAAFEAAPVPPEIEQEVVTAYQQLGQGPVAVRSSATAEDLPQASFAGQQDTYLNILGEKKLLDAVRRCWASLWTDRAIAYRLSQGIDPMTVKLAVVVQRMAAAEAAGVMFTANTITGERAQTLIDANPGLGEAVVSGLVTPDHYVLQQRRWGWRVVERRIGRREVVVRPLSGGGVEHVTGSTPLQQAALPDKALRRLASLGAAIQRHFGSPQDIEWAWAGGELSILQARPITALPSPPPRATFAHRMLANNFIEMMPVRPYPLDLDTWISALGSAVEPIFELLGLDWSLSHLFETEDGIVLSYRPNFPRPTWKVLLAPFRLSWRILRYPPLRWQSDPLLVNAINHARQLEAQALGSQSWEGLLALVEQAKEVPHQAAGEVRSRYFPRAIFSVVRLRLLLALLGQAKHWSTFLTSTNNKTLEMNRALETLADKVRSDPSLARTAAAHPAEDLGAALEALPAGRGFLAELKAFLDLYGHRETVVSTSLEPTWKEAPAVALGVIKGFAAHPPPPPSQAPAWQAARDQVLQHPWMRFAPLRSAFLDVLAEARTLMQIREDTHFYATLSMPIFRRTLLECGRRLVEAGILDHADEVYYLQLAELEQAGSHAAGGLLPQDLSAALRAAVLRRKTQVARLEKEPLVDPRLFPPQAAQGGTLLQGASGSPGIAEGPARIIRDGSEFEKLQPGDVLVAPYTNPAWTPLFQRAAAVVVDTGSVASHAAIVAREYGIPAVMGTLTGTQVLHDGERVRVDGSRGVVSRLAPETSQE